MSDQRLLGEVKVAPGGGLTVRMRWPKRGLGAALVLMALLGCLITVAGVMMGTDRQSPDRASPRIFFLVFGLGVTIGCGLPALHLLTRWRQVSIDHGEVILERGWCLGGSARRHRLSEFRGLHRYTRQMGAMNAASAVGSLVGIAAAGVTGIGVVAGKTVTYHFLELVHLQDKSQNVVLTGSEDASAIARLADSLSDSLRLPLLTATLDGYADQRRLEPGPEAIDPVRQREWSESESTIAEAGGDHRFQPADMPQRQTASVPAPPHGMHATTNGSEMNILLPSSKTPLVAGCIMGGVFGAVGLLCIIFLPDGKWGGVIPLAMGLLVFLVGSMNSRRRNSVVLSSAGIQYKMAAMGTRPIHIPWVSVRDVSVARSSIGKPGLLIVTDGPEAWLAVGLSSAALNWLAEAVRERARAEARRRSESRPTSRDQHTGIVDDQ